MWRLGGQVVPGAQLNVEPLLLNVPAGQCDTEHLAHRARSAVRTDHVPGAHGPLAAPVHRSQRDLDALGVLGDPHRVQARGHGDTGKAGDALAENAFQLRLVIERHTRDALVVALRGVGGQEGAVAVPQMHANVGGHGLEHPIEEAESLPDPVGILVGGDRSLAGIDVDVALHDHRANSRSSQ